MLTRVNISFPRLLPYFHLLHSNVRQRSIDVVFVQKAGRNLFEFN